MSEGAITRWLWWPVATPKRLWLTAALAVLAVVFWVISGSHLFQECVQANHARNSGQSLQEGISAFFSIRRWCVGVFIDGNGEATTGLFTVVLAISTIGLWGVTERTLRHAEGSSERDLRAYVSMFLSRIEGVAAENQPVITFAVQNNGKTPAYECYMLADICLITKYPAPEGVVLPQLGVRISDKEATFTKVAPTVLGPSRTIFATVQMDDRISETTAMLIAEGKRAIYGWGFASYRDAFGKYWRLDFRYFCAGSLRKPNELFIEHVEEQEIDKRTHESTLRVSGKKIPVTLSFSPMKKNPLPPTGENMQQ